MIEFARPQTRYVSVGDGDVAFQVFGEGSTDLVWVWGLGTHVEMGWDTPIDAEYLRRLGTFSRVIILDRRGTGASDGVTRGAIPTWESWTEDILAVIDEVGCSQVSLYAEMDSGPIAILFAALHPERVQSLILANTFCRAMVADDYLPGLTQDAADLMVSFLGQYWGTTDLVQAVQPSLADDRASLEAVARCQRASATPRTAAAQYRYIMGVDVREALPLIQAPTLVLHNEDNATVSVEAGRYLSEHIAGAQLLTFQTPAGDVGVSVLDPSMDAIAEFLTGRRPPIEVDRVLATVLFLDIVGSTERLVTLGDRDWKHVLDQHDRLVREDLAHFRGHEVKTTGDGFVATFDGPARAIRCAQAIVLSVKKLGIEVRAGLHVGECELRGDDIAGITVHVAARVGALAGPSEILVSSTVKDLVAGSEIDFRASGEHSLKGVPGRWNIFAVAP